MSLENLTKTTRSSGNILLAAILIIAAVAVYKWTIVPHTNYLSAAQRYDMTLDGIARKNKFIKTNIKVQQEKLKKLQKKFEQLNSRLFTLTKATEFFSDIQSIAEETGCQISSVNFSLANPGNRAKTTNVYMKQARLDIIGSYENITKLISRLQNRPQQVKVDAISIKPIRQIPGKLNCDAAIVIYISGKGGQS